MFPVCPERGKAASVGQSEAKRIGSEIREIIGARLGKPWSTLREGNEEPLEGPEQRS